MQIAGNKPFSIHIGSWEVEFCISLLSFPSSCHRVPSATRTHCLVVVELEYQSSIVIRVIILLTSNLVCLQLQQIPTCWEVAFSFWCSFSGRGLFCDSWVDVPAETLRGGTSVITAELFWQRINHNVLAVIPRGLILTPCLSGMSPAQQTCAGHAHGQRNQKFF